MDLEMVLNELSLLSPAEDIFTARQRMSELIQVLREATASGAKRVLRTSADINSLELAPNYPVSRWRNDAEVEREEKGFFRSLITNSPLWTGIAASLKEQFDLSEVWYRGEVAQGLGFALISDGLSVSLAADECWNCSFLQVDLRRFNEDAELIDEQVSLVHACARAHIQQHEQWIERRCRLIITNGEELWNRRAELLPNLEFCDRIEKQLREILPGQQELTIVYKSLLELQDCCQNWKQGALSFSSYAIEESGESKVTLQRYGKERTFRCPDGKERLFERHIKLRLCNWRIHFFDLEPGRVIVGYIGRHLPTVKYKT